MRSPYAQAPKGRCKDHEEGGLKASKDQRIKKAYPEALVLRLKDSAEEIAGTLEIEAPGGAEEAGEVVCVHGSTLWHWRQHDADFDKAVRAALLVRRKLQTGNVEHSLYKDIVEGKASAVDRIFWLTNRAKDDWKDVRRIETESIDERLAFARLLGVTVEDLPENLAELGEKKEAAH